MRGSDDGSRLGLYLTFPSQGQFIGTIHRVNQSKPVSPESVWLKKGIDSRAQQSFTTPPSLTGRQHRSPHDIVISCQQYSLARYWIRSLEKDQPSIFTHLRFVPTPPQENTPPLPTPPTELPLQKLFET